MTAFRGLRGRRVVVNTSTGEAFQGVVLTAGWFTSRVGTDAGTFGLLDGASPQVEAAGVARIRHRIVTWIQELP